MDSEFGESGFDLTFACESYGIWPSLDRESEPIERLCALSWEGGLNLGEVSVGRGSSRKVHRIPGRVGVDEKSIEVYRHESLV